MGTDYAINTQLFNTKMQSAKDEASQLKITDATMHKNYACGNMTSLLILARQQEYLIEVSNLYKEHVINNVLIKEEMCKERTEHTTTALRESICYKEY